MADSPAYINNHEELQKALQEGVFYLEKLEPIRVDLNRFGQVEVMICHQRIQNTSQHWETMTEEISIPARSILVATGTQPNIAYEFEHKGTFNRIGTQYQHYEDENGELFVSHGTKHCKEKNFGPFTSYQHHDRRVSLIGDTHPVFHGNVVKAIASGMRTYPKILAVLKSKLGKGNMADYATFAQQMHYQFSSQVSDIKRCTDNVLELTVKAPLAAKHFHPGQFYRLQNYETSAVRIGKTTLQIEPLALIAAGVNHAKNTLKFIVIEKGSSSKLCATFKMGEPISLMGPTGIRAKIPLGHETILIVGEQISLAFLESYGSALRAKGNKVLYLANFKHKNELYCQAAIETAADVIIWSTLSGDLIQPSRAQDFSAHGDALDVLLSYAHGKLSSQKKKEISLADIDRIYLIGNTNLLRRFQAFRHTHLQEFLLKNPRVVGSVYSTMQCMLKGVCAQCLQWQIDPETGKRTKAVFACSWPEQPLELIDFDNIDERQIQNYLQEQQSSLWVDYLFDKYNIQRI